MASKEVAVGVKEVAAKVGTDPKTLRVFLRKQGVGVGSGKRYAWASMSDPGVRQIVRDWRKAQEASTDA
jgi:hypothetical protein